MLPNVVPLTTWNKEGIRAFSATLPAKHAQPSVLVLLVTPILNSLTGHTIYFIMVSASIHVLKGIIQLIVTAMVWFINHSLSPRLGKDYKVSINS